MREDTILDPILVLCPLQTLFKTLAISFSTMTLFTGITPLYGTSLQYAGPASLVWGWVVVSFFTWFVGVAMAEICSSFPVRAFVRLLSLPFLDSRLFAQSLLSDY